MERAKTTPGREVMNTFCTATPAGEWAPVSAEDEFDGRMFYELMQAYRHAPLHDLAKTIEAFEAVKSFCRDLVEEAQESRYNSRY